MYALSAWYPPVGVSIGVLAVLGVLVPLFRDLGEIGRREKALWTFIMFALVLLEIRSIYRDRDVHDKEQADARAEQLRQFGEIAKGIDKTIDNSVIAMNNIKTNLETSERTLKNTQPYASLEFQRLIPYGPSLPTKAGYPLRFNVNFTNSGNDPAIDAVFDAKVYFGKADDDESLKQITSAFDKWWIEAKHKHGGSLAPHVPGIFSFDTDVLTDRDIKGLMDHTLTPYCLMRFKYSDRTGHWIGDECGYFQDITHDFEMAYNCKSHNNSRYRDVRR